MREVWKFEVAYAGRPHPPILMPEGARLLHVDAADGKVWVWALVDPDAPQQSRSLGYFPTGSPIGTRLDYVGTAIDDDLVWHVFEAI